MSEKTLFAESIYIDPANCDSQVSYKINRTSYGDPERPGINASVLLSDCSRRIEWYFNGDDEYIEKIDRAIDLLNVFRDLLASEVKKLNRQNKSTENGGQ